MALKLVLLLPQLVVGGHQFRDPGLKRLLLIVLDRTAVRPAGYWLSCGVERPLGDLLEPDPVKRALEERGKV